MMVNLIDTAEAREVVRLMDRVIVQTRIAINLADQIVAQTERDLNSARGTDTSGEGSTSRSAGARPGDGTSPPDGDTR